MHPNTLATAATGGVATVDNLLAFEFHHAGPDDLALTAEQLPALVALCASYTQEVRPKFQRMAVLARRVRAAVATRDLPSPSVLRTAKAANSERLALQAEVDDLYVDRTAEALALLTDRQRDRRAELIAERDDASRDALAGELRELVAL